MKYNVKPTNFAGEKRHNASCTNYYKNCARG